MTDSDVDFEFGVEFPTKNKSKSRPKKSSSKPRRRKLPPIPEGAGQRFEKITRYMNGRWQELFTYQCPSNSCVFIVRNSLNKEGALKTFMTHIRLDHRNPK